MRLQIVCFWLAFLCFTLSALVSMAQINRFSTGLFPEASLSYKLNQSYSITHKIETQHGFFDKQSKLNEELKYRHVLTDLQTFIAKRISPNVKIDIGYQYRIETGENTHRPIQQIAFVKRGAGYRIGHRVRTDQTFFEAASILWRARYQVKSQIPLQGMQLDPGEKYLIISNELIYMQQNKENDLENRFTVNLGFYYDDNNKLEIGLDYRTDDYLVPNRFRHRLWLKVGYYKSL